MTRVKLDWEIDVKDAETGRIYTYTVRAHETPHSAIMRAIFIHGGSNKVEWAGNPRIYHPL